MSSMDQIRELLPINFNRDLAKTCADFYLLEYLAAEGNEDAEKKLKQFERELSQEFLYYAGIACAGELRHLINRGEMPRGIRMFVEQIIRIPCREDCWLEWAKRYHIASNNMLKRFFRCAAELFDDEVFWETPNIGGSAWAMIARAAYDFLSGFISPRTFIDRCWTLQHNNAIFFDKAFSISELRRVLIRQSEGDYEYLFGKASEEVKALWRNRQTRRTLEELVEW